MQRFRQWWLLLVVASVASIGWLAWIQQVLLGEPFGSEPRSDAVVWGLWLVAGLALPLAVALLRLETTVDGGALHLRLWPVKDDTIALDRMLAVSPITYRPLSGYLVLGYGRTPRGEVVWRTRGTEGVRISLGSEQRIVVGSRRPEDLAAALRDRV